jgi:hypothetical protein
MMIILMAVLSMVAVLVVHGYRPRPHRLHLGLDCNIACALLVPCVLIHDPLERGNRGGDRRERPDFVAHVQ